MDEPVDLLIVGAGAIGLTAAWRAAAQGLRVRVVERAHAGAGASTAAAGLLGLADPAKLVGEAGAGNRDAIARWPAFAAELEEASGRSIDLRREGALHVVHDEADLAGLAELAASLAAAGVAHERLDADAVRADEPGVRNALAGVLVPGDASVATDRLAAALALAATRAGVLVEEGAEVVALVRDGDGRAQGVRLADGSTRAAALTLAAVGAWSGAADWLPAEVRPAVRPLAGEWLLLRGEPVCRRVVRTPHGGVSPRADGRLWMGTTVRDAGFVTRPRLDAIAGILANWTRVLPAVGALEVERIGVGLRPGRDDGPLVGATAIPGLAIATGHGRDGIIHAPLAGAVVAALAAGDTLSGHPNSPKPDRT